MVKQLFFCQNLSERFLYLFIPSSICRTREFYENDRMDLAIEIPRVSRELSSVSAHSFLALSIRVLKSQARRRKLENSRRGSITTIGATIEMNTKLARHTRDL